MAKDPLYPRYVELPLGEALMDTPVVLIHGPRQSGKTTLARGLGEPAGYVYFSFDDDVTTAAAGADPWASWPSCRSARSWTRCSVCPSSSRP